MPHVREIMRPLPIAALALAPAFVLGLSVMRGQNGQMPNGFEMTFGGIDAGDGVGDAIRVGDFDADGIRDILIGAPNGDGPSNSRANAATTGTAAAISLAASTPACSP